MSFKFQLRFVFIIHKAINIKWVKFVCKNFKQTNFKAKFMLILDIILFILVTLNVVTGILISKVLFSSLGVSENGLGVFHKFVATWSLIIISVHIAKY